MSSECRNIAVITFIHFMVCLNTMDVHANAVTDITDGKNVLPNPKNLLHLNLTYIHQRTSRNPNVDSEALKTRLLSATKKNYLLPRNTSSIAPDRNMNLKLSERSWHRNKNLWIENYFKGLTRHTIASVKSGVKGILKTLKQVLKIKDSHTTLARPTTKPQEAQHSQISSAHPQHGMLEAPEAHIPSYEFETENEIIVYMLTPEDQHQKPSPRRYFTLELFEESPPKLPNLVQNMRVYLVNETFKEKSANYLILVQPSHYKTNISLSISHETYIDNPDKPEKKLRNANTLILYLTEPFLLDSYPYEPTIALLHLKHNNGS